MRNAWIIVKIIACATLCGLGVLVFCVQLNKNNGNGFVQEDESLVKKFLVFLGPVCSAIIAYRNGDSKITVTHVFSCNNNNDKDIALQTLKQIV